MNNANNIPKTVRQAFAMLDSLTSQEGKSNFLMQSKSDFVCEQHFGLGLWIRDNWIYGTEDDSCMRMLAGLGEDEVCLEHLNTVSNRFLGRYYDHLKSVAKG